MAQITLRDYLQEIEDAISSKRVDEALASCQYVLAFFPESLEAQRLLGEVYLAQGKLEDAQQAFDWVLTNDPDNVIAYCSRALVSERMSDYDTALDCYQQAYELSRGNGQIRQAFNQLSEKVGQPGFMFSRAGLARLYMRGDLLIQAAQEWDIVLSMYPDRLDARTGLLEVYWRQGLHEKAIPLAEQILRDVPGCIKALLLLAYMVAPQDMLRSQDLIKQVEALDPDLVLAHDLFADHMANQPGDPFLKLLSKSPAVLGASGASASKAPSQPADALAGLNVGSDALSAWGSNANWGNDATLVKPRSDEAAAQPDASSLPSWMSEDIPARSQSATPSWDNNDAWNAAAPQQASTTNAQPEQAEPWQLLQNALNSISPEAASQASDPGLEASNAPAWPDTSDIGFVPLHADVVDIADSQEAELAADDHISDDANQSWSFAIPEAAKNNAAVPTWLNMLAQDEAKSAQPQHPEVAAPQEEQPVPPEKMWQPEPAEPALQKAEPVKPSEPAPEPADTPQSEEESDEELPFGPAWLKSLGAASLDGTGAYDFSELVRQQPSDELPSQPEVAVASAEVWPAQSSQPEIPAPGQQSSGASWEQPSAQKSSGASWEQPSAQKSSGASWEQPTPPVAQPKPQGFQDPSWLLESPSQPQKRQSSPTWEQPDEQQQTPAASSAAESALNQLVEESQSAPADNDPWAAWQSTYAPSQAQQPQQQPAENQDFWSSFESNREPAPLEQPSWMQQLSQSSAAPADQSPDVTYEEPAEQITPSWYEEQAPEPAREEAVQPAEIAPVAEPVRPAAEDPWAILNQQAQSQSIDYDWLAQLAGGSQSSASASTTPEEMTNTPEEKPDEGQQAIEEQNLVTTLEELEQKLRSRGFTPLEPNSLASIAQSQENGQQSEEKPQEVTEGDRSSFTSASEPSLSSALAELGNFFPRPAEPAPLEETRAPSAEPEPSWLAALGTVPAATNTPPSEVQVPEQPITETAPQTTDTRQPEPVIAPPSVAPARPAEVAAFQPSEHASTEPQAAPVARVNPLLDSELETTMKRPAVRLQPMQRAATHDAGRMGANRARSGERAGQRSTEGGNISHRERLLRGYQAQLIGDFDNAMQEYRVIIRNAPELLGEVVSNVRALLKLAPNYSSGYRVLGDAYMRQGEYLQAMEAYNKALTMAKKAKA